jgi:hypothetical protein
MPIRIIRHILLLLKKLCLLGKEYKYRDKDGILMLSGIKFHLEVQQVITNNLWDINGETLVTVVKKINSP